MDQVNEALTQVTPIWNEIYSIFRTGFYEVNDVRGLIIGLIGAYVLTNYSRVLFVVLGCVVAHVAVDVLGPVIVNKAAFHLPPLVELNYWRGLLSLAAGYLIVVTVFYAVKRLFQGMTSGGHATYGH
jgi:hypothetical protein